MKSEWSSRWKASSQPRKQRKYRFNAPLHVRHRLMSVRLSKELKGQLGKRSLPVRKGDEVRVMSGSGRKTTGAVSRVDLSSLKVYAEGITVKKVDGSEVQRALEPSNLMITKLNMDDKMRRKQLERKALVKKEVIAKEKKEKRD
ncbi:MAG: 50S ribosomal protein L24 [Candidatus Aenigmarchaeota archaeon]|nr:50S ribosomal protein L24 [Candidatus Aenigmarchaeota archaeon]